MDVCTYLAFRNCIRNPHFHLRTIGHMTFDDSTVACTEHFVECVATAFGCSYMIYAPITLDAIHYARRAMSAFETTAGELGSFKVLPEEMLLDGIFASSCSLIVESLPAGTLLREALYTFSQEHLLEGLNELKQRLLRSGVCHMNLTLDNIIVDNNYRWHPIRSYYAIKGRRRDLKALKRLEEQIMECSLPESFVPTLGLLASRNELDYPGKVLPLCERRRRVITERGTGFCDEKGEMVIEDVYRSATDFCEERSVVTLKSGLMGVINRRGDYIVEPIYERIRFDTTTGDITAYQALDIHLFDYIGRAKSQD